MVLVIVGNVNVLLNHSNSPAIIVKNVPLVQASATCTKNALGAPSKTVAKKETVAQQKRSTLFHLSAKLKASSIYKLYFNFFNIILITEGGNACLVQVDKEYCPYWTYIYDLNKNNTVNLRIVQQGCHPPLGAKYYAGGAFCIVVFLGLLVIIIYKVVQKQKDAKEYAIYMTNLKTTSYNENPYYKSPKTEYKMPEEAKFN